VHQNQVKIAGQRLDYRLASLLLYLAETVGDLPSSLSGSLERLAGNQ
jgi:hypothetical protein